MITLTTYDWVPAAPRGHVRDIRVRWALEEAGLPYKVVSTSFKNKTLEHFKHQPFGQVPFIQDGDISLFETGAILNYIGELSPAVMPQEKAGRLAVSEWIYAALNSVEVPVIPWTMMQFSKDKGDAGIGQQIVSFLNLRLEKMEIVLKEREWLTDKFSVADIVMADIFRIVDRFNGLDNYPACKVYMKRAIARPAFKKAYDDQMAHFAAND